MWRIDRTWSKVDGIDNSKKVIAVTGARWKSNGEERSWIMKVSRDLG